MSKYIILSRGDWLVHPILVHTFVVWLNGCYFFLYLFEASNHAYANSISDWSIIPFCGKQSCLPDLAKTNRK